MLEEPTEGREMRTYLRSRGRPVIADKHEKLSQAVELRGQGKGIRDIAKAVGVGKSTVDRWLFEHDASQKCPAVG
jgi:transposase-like protein